MSATDNVLARYITGRVAGALARQLASVTVSWEIYDRTRSTWFLGLVGLVQVVPVVALSIPAGALIDRWGRRRAALLAQLGTIAALSAIWASAHFHLSIAGAYAALFVLGCATSLGSPATAAMMPLLVPRERLRQANTYSSTGWELASITGPAIGGGLIAWSGGAETSYAVAVICGVVFLLMLLTLNVVEPPKEPSHTQSWGAGLRYVLHSRLLLPAMMLDMFAVLFAGVTALLPVFAEDILKVGPTGLGWLRAAPSFGALTMSIIGVRLAPWKHAGRVLLIVVAGFGVVTIAFGLSRSFPLSLALLFIGGVLDNVSVVIRITLEQLATPDALRGRVSAVHYVFIGLSNELGELESGVAAGVLGVTPSVVFGGVMTLAVVGLIAMKFPKLRRWGALGSIQPEPP